VPRRSPPACPARPSACPLPIAVPPRPALRRSPLRRGSDIPQPVKNARRAPGSDAVATLGPARAASTSTSSRLGTTSLVEGRTTAQLRTPPPASSAVKSLRRAPNSAPTPRPVMAPARVPRVRLAPRSRRARSLRPRRALPRLVIRMVDSDFSESSPFVIAGRSRYSRLGLSGARPTASRTASSPGCLLYAVQTVVRLPMYPYATSTAAVPGRPRAATSAHRRAATEGSGSSLRTSSHSVGRSRGDRARSFV
jgi:hypothetical protein